MSLTAQELKAIRGVVREETTDIADSKFTAIRSVVRKEATDIIDSKVTDIRTMIREEITSIIDTRLQPIEVKLDDIDGRLTAIEADVKELYQLV
jgi:hypothetical protein